MFVKLSFTCFLHKSFHNNCAFIFQQNYPGWVLKYKLVLILGKEKKQKLTVQLSFHLRQSCVTLDILQQLSNKRYKSSSL